jgi:hypothetical protein
MSSPIFLRALAGLQFLTSKLKSARLNLSGRPALDWTVPDCQSRLDGGRKRRARCNGSLTLTMPEKVRAYCVATPALSVSPTLKAVSLKRQFD